MEIKILGTGCAGCMSLYKTVVDVASELKLDATIVKEEDIMKIMEYNVMTLPALVIDGKVVAKGKISSIEVKTLLMKSPFSLK
ncbi:MAG: thioredoxin family protein [Bacteroidales bacterium]|nr:thioredoxin family protein [Bacteroidales bacterium]